VNIKVNARNCYKIFPPIIAAGNSSRAVFLFYHEASFVPFISMVISPLAKIKSISKPFFVLQKFIEGYDEKKQT